MRALTQLGVIVAWLWVPALSVAAPPWELEVQGGVLAYATSSVTRAALAELRVGVRREVIPHVRLAAAYRGSWRDAGTDLVGVFGTTQRLQLGAQLTTTLVGLGWTAELAAVPTLEAYTLHGPGAAPPTYVISSVGAALELEVAVPINARWRGTFRSGATWRRHALDFVALAGVTWGWGGAMFVESSPGRLYERVDPR